MLVSDLGCNGAFVHARCMTVDKLLSPLEPHFPHLSNGNDDIAHWVVMRITEITH